ncbi:MAG: type I-D CRISPR-associated protein Csc2 [Anaerolineae bacterium]|nr:type I-D CRISPR-associated protein Csc2 [Anaerolineae bacterium]
MSKLNDFVGQMASIEDVLEPREVKGKKVAKPIYTRQVATIIGVKTAKSRFLPVSHEGHGIETYIDKVELLGKTRAEFIARKLKGIERRAHMALFRELVEQRTDGNWQAFFADKFGKECVVPDGLCIACWNCSLFGGLEPGRRATFSRIRYFDTYSAEDMVECVAMLESEEGMGIGNQVYEDLSKERGAETYHLYEYVKAGTHFPFITIIESPTLLDVAGYLWAVRRADEHGYGKYSANHGKFDTEFLAVSTGYPRFSVLDMLEWMENGQLENRFQADDPQVTFDSIQEVVTLYGDEVEKVAAKLKKEFGTYLAAL